MKSNILVKGVLQRMAGLDILNGFAGKVISDCIDIAIDKIKKADKNRKPKNQTMETRIYQVTIDALNEFPYNKYKKEEKVYDAAESILKELKRGNRDYQEAVKLGLKMLVSQVTDDICKDFLKTLCYEICMDENDVLYKEIALIQQEQLNENVNEGFKDNNQNHKKTQEKLDEIQKGINGLKERQDVGGDYEPENANKIPIINRADEYAQKWDKNVFLNDFRKRDKKKGKNIKLREIYLEEHLPYYVWKADDEVLYDLKDLLKEYIVDNNEKKMLLILGQPGIGKSTLITWVMANLVEKKEQVLVYQFASDLKKVNWQGEDILEEIFKELRLGGKELNNKVLIFDGFDEISISGDRERILNKLYQELKKMNRLDNFSLVITCRENYVDQSNLENIDYITLQTWNEEQIRNFCEVYEEVIIRKNSEPRVNKNSEIKVNKIIEKKDIMGIPLILYMVLALNVDIERGNSIVDVYDQIFSLKRGGIYDRGYDVEHRINEPETKRHIHHISQRIAFWMFENNEDEATISQEKFEEICENEMSELGEKGREIRTDTLIGNFFRLKHCEGKGTDELQFVHHSIYEYFVVVYFFESIHKLTSKEEVAGKLGELLKDGYLSQQILEFIKCKFDTIKRYNLSDITREVFNIMLRDGMTYHIKEKYKNIIVREMNIFSNMLEIVCLWNSNLGELNNEIVTYLNYNQWPSLNLKGLKLKNADLYKVNLIGANLSNAYLEQVYLSEADLSEANLSGAHLDGFDFEGIDLSGANMSGTYLKNAYLGNAYLIETNLMGAHLEGAYLGNADLEGANLEKAHIEGIQLEGTDLNNTIFDEKQVKRISKRYSLEGSKVLLSNCNETISYEEYCRKNKM